MTCKAKQVSDSMTCTCGAKWDVNDPSPPQCRKNNEAEVEQLRAENAELREELKHVASALNGLRAHVECKLWPKSGFASASNLDN